MIKLVSVFVKMKWFCKSLNQFVFISEKAFVHEFAKLRYGVFEEFGYPGDSQYPMFYYEQSYVDGILTSTLTPNFCTDAPLQGIRQ